MIYASPVNSKVLIGWICLVSAGCQSTASHDRVSPVERSRGSGEASKPGTNSGKVVQGRTGSVPFPGAQQLPVAPGTSGCGKPTEELGIRDGAVQVGGSRRTFLRYVSPNYDANRRHILIIGYHGLGLDGSSPRRDHKWTSLEESSGDAAIFIYANAAGGAWDGGGNSRDVLFFDELVRATGEEFCLEKSRVFVHGFSNGAFFVNSLVNSRNTAIRGVISVAGGGGGAKIPAMIIHGKQDENVGFYGSAPSTVNAYARANGCKAPSSIEQLKTDTCQLLEGCPPKLPVWVCPWSGNHHWPEFTLPDVWKFITTT